MPPPLAGKTLLTDWRCPVALGNYGGLRSKRTCSPVFLSCLSERRPLRYAVLGAGFAGLSVVWHLLKHSPKELNLCVDIYDEVGIGGGASGVSGGLLHPYSPKVKLLWQGAECWKESLKLLSIAEAALGSEDSNLEIGESGEQFGEFVVRRRGKNETASVGFKPEIVPCATENEVNKAVRLFTVSTMDAARSGINQQVNLTAEMANEIKQAETQIKRKLPIRNQISERRPIDDLTRMGMNESIIRRALIIMHQRDEVEYKRERRVILQKV